MKNLALLVCCSAALQLWGGNVPAGKPESVGVSAERLQRIHDAVMRHVEAGVISGAVTLVARRGHIVNFEAHGQMDLEARRPMTKDALFRLASMSKPVTAVAVLTLVEEGEIRLNDPVSKFIPEFKEMKVAVPKSPAGNRADGRGGANGAAAVPEFYTVPALRQVTVFDLLTHTSGIGSGPMGSSELRKTAPGGPDEVLASRAPKVALAPLEFQPGSQWAYSGREGPDLLGRIAEIVSGQTYDQVLKGRLFDPLGMKDTGFYPTESNQRRLVTLYQRSGNGLMKSENQAGPFASKTYFSGAAGMYSTAEYYLQFAQMLVNGGMLNGHRIPSPKTVELIASNHVGDLFNQGRPARGMGFGFLVEVVQESVAAGIRVSNGAFGWDGAYGTRVWIDPKEKMVSILMIQTTPYSADVIQHRDFENAVMQALID